MKRGYMVGLVIGALLVAAAAVATPLSESGILPANLGRGIWILQVKSGQTTANTKIIDARNGAGTNKFYADIEGDVYAAGTMSVTGAATFSSTVAATGAISGPRTVVSAASGTTALTAAQSGAVVANTGTADTTTFTLPAAAAGLNYCFVEAGDAAGELLINPATGDAIVIKATVDGAVVAPAAGTGVKNAAGTNVKGDHVCLAALDATTWIGYSQAGTWASQ